MRSDLLRDTERPWVELVESAGVVAVRDRLLMSGVPASQAAGVALWLSAHASRRREVSDEGARRYRRLLESLPPS